MAQYLPPEDLRVGNGTETVFGFTFPYLRAQDIAITVDGIAVPVVLVGTAQVSINPAPANGAKIRIYRNTPAQFPQHLFATGVPMLPKYIDENNRQLLYALQEGLLEFSAVDSVASEALDTANLALVAAQGAVLATGRAVRAPNTDPTMLPLPGVAARANKFVAFNNAGDPVVVAPISGSLGDFAVDLANNADPSLGAGLVGYRGRTTHARLTDLMSVRDFSLGAVDGVTSNQVGLVAAVSAAYLAGSELYWPVGTYVSTESIPNFHSVRHFGPGVISAPDATYYVEPKKVEHKSTIYVDLAGSDANDGLAPGRAMATIARAFAVMQGVSILPNLGNGAWRVKIADGVGYSGAAWTTPVSVRTWLEVEGAVSTPHTPSVVIDGVGSTANGGLYFQQGPSQIKLKNLKSRNFTANSVSSGFVVEGKGIDRAWVEDCHGVLNRWAGVNVDNIGTFIMTGGEWTANTQYQIRVRGNVGISIGAYSATNRVKVGNGTGVAIQIRDAVTGHIDYTDIADTATGLQVTNVSRVTLVGATFLNSTIGWTAGACSTVAHDTTTTFTNVSQRFALTQNAVFGQDGSTNEGGEGMEYEYFNNRYVVGRRLWAPTTSIPSSTAYAWCTSKTGTADFSHLVPTGASVRLTGGDVADRTKQYLHLDLPNSRIRAVIANTVCWSATTSQLTAGADNVSTLGTGGARWSTVYAATGTINTSDERSKEQIQGIDERVLRAWAKVEYVQYKFRDACEVKQDGARWHFGVIAQRVKAAFESEGLDAFKYGILCRDEWEATPAEYDEEGNVVVAASEAGDRYGIRYEEALAVECAYLRSLIHK